jgi:molybdate transport system substrate-binding protein
MHSFAKLILLALGVHTMTSLLRPPSPLLPPAQQPPSSSPLTVYAAASLTEAFAALGRAFEARHPGTTIRFNFAGSQQLAFQLEQGAPADLFASADRRWIDYVKEKGLVSGETPVFARNRLVVILPKGNPARIERLAHLARRGTKLVVAAEAVPAGTYTREMLRNLAAAPGYPKGYEAQVLANVVSQEESVKGVVSKVQLGEADAGVVYQSDVTPGVDRYVTRLEIPDASNVIAGYRIAVLQAATNTEAARLFVDLISSQEGQRIIRQHGLLPGAASATGPR